MIAFLQTGYGEADKALAFGRVPVPRISDYEVLVRVRAASLNQIDAKLRWGYGKSILNSSVADREPEIKQKPPPYIIGRDFSGEIVATGPLVPNLSHCQIGNSVMGHIEQLSAQGSWSEYVKVPFWNLTTKPDWLSFTDAAAIPFCLSGALELWIGAVADLLRSQSSVRSVFVHGASGGLGFILNFLLRAMGVETTVGCHPDRAARLYLAGCMNVIDSTNLQQVEEAIASSHIMMVSNGILNSKDIIRDTKNIFSQKLRDQPKKAQLPTINYFTLVSAELEASEFMNPDDLKQKNVNLLLKDNFKEYISTVQQAYASFATRTSFVNSNQLSLHPNYSPRRAYHHGFKNALDLLFNYCKEHKIDPTLVANVDTVFDFADALQVNQKMDDGDYCGKLVVDLNSLWNNNKSFSADVSEYYLQEEVIVDSCVSYSLMHPIHAETLRPSKSFAASFSVNKNSQ